MCNSLENHADPSSTFRDAAKLELQKMLLDPYIVDTVETQTFDAAVLISPVFMTPEEKAEKCFLVQAQMERARQGIRKGGG